MIKKLLFTIAFIAGTLLNATAQTNDPEHVYLIKGDKVVAKYSLEDVDYVSFRLPEGVSEAPIEVKVDDAGKNYIKYSINTINPSVKYVHCVVSETKIDYYLQEYCGSTLENATPELMNAAINMAMFDYGFEGMGTATYTQFDGETADDLDIEILGGQRYYVIAWEVDGDFKLIDNPYYTIVTTKPAETSPAKLTVEYAGLNERGNATFNFNVDDRIMHVYTMYGLKSVLSQYIENNGFDKALLMWGQKNSSEELSTNEWPVPQEDDYCLYLLGIDSNGDWVKTQCEFHETPAVKEDNGPKITIFNKSKGDGKVSVNFEITPSNVTEAYVRLAGENFVDDRLNMGYTLAEIAMGGDAEDITSTINNFGEYTYTNNELERNWYSLLIMGKNSDGTTVTRINFHSHQEGSEWDCQENINISSSAKPHTAAPVAKTKSGMTVPVITTKPAAILNLNAGDKLPQRTLK